MANSTSKLKKAKFKLAAIEEPYYEAAAYVMLLTEGIHNPTVEDVLKARNYLSNTYLGLSILLAPAISERDIRLLYDAACGIETKASARSLNSNSANLRQKRSHLFKTLNVKNADHAVYRLTHMGYFPPKQLFTRSINLEETDDIPSK
ncbi:hypothetical protein [Rickettsiella endosymbiont of Dermanyssus gallinae]|uniref:hypothetical protein n=1 Tax=Rickettsiella endosymbiont of Dermanyssus gallinae TaxID=2856608 RepID=UPI001C52DAC8|nr:hypothetical protein [Rickettsiella endosymbiont of Dermanyssus gallinae]